MAASHLTVKSGTHNSNSNSPHRLSVLKLIACEADDSAPNRMCSEIIFVHLDDWYVLFLGIL